MRCPQLSVTSVALALLISGVTQIAHASLITNGTFDTDLSGWTTTGTTTGNTWVAGTAHVGRPGTPGVAILEQTFDIPFDSNQLEISFDYEWQVSAPTLPDMFLVELIYESTSLGTVTETLISEASNTVAFLSPIAFSTILFLTDLDNSLGNGTIRFTLTENNSDVGTRIELDNVFVQAIPEPTTLSLFGLGAVSLFGYRRMKRKQAA